MATEITMPQQSDTMTEGTVVAWRKKEGDKVKQGEVVAEIETDKAVMEMESFDSGTIAAILVPEGQKVPVGSPIAIVATGKENPAEIKKQYASKGGASVAPANASEPARQAPAAASAGGGARVEAGTSLATATLEEATRGEVHESASIGHGATRSPAQPVPPMPSHGDGNGNGGRVFATPLARRIAADKGIDLHQLRGSGPNGRIVQQDVLSFTPPKPGAERSAAAGPSAPRVAGKTEIIPLTKMRSAIAAALQRSKQQIPHFYETIDIDVEELSAMRARVNEQLDRQNVKLSLADFISKAVCVALLRHPAVNATFDGTQITRYSDVHLGMAVSVPDGLIVPVLKHADKMGLRELREKTGPLIERARSGKQKQDEASGGTFTISSLGSFGIREFAAIINPPQVAILAVGSAEKRPVVKGNQIVARTMMSVTLSADHRVVDGATAAEFLRTLKSLLEEPGMMLV
ncbi:MAG TPA: dihydrolipoamide acetyltransferase family protein [Tepidisphaeraceae bacterium]|nr:dihydrolipoamide acetyltransferase family protein [Tepidisphaeraceae bacterium]